MVSCCVPHCTSKQGRTKEVSFHEFPVNADAKQRWLAEIVNVNGGRKRFLHKIAADRNKVCSRHFCSTDYSLSTTKRRLLPHAIPSLFPDRDLAEASSSSLTAPIRQLHRLGEKIPPACQSAVVAVQNRKLYPMSPVFVNVGHRNSAPLPQPSSKRSRFDSELVTGHVNVSSLTSASFQDVGVQVDCRPSRQSCPDTTIKMYKTKFRCCKKQLLRLQRRLAALKERQAEISKQRVNAAQHKKVDAIVRSAKEGSRRAGFLLEQINVFGQTKPRWQPNTVRLCTVWQQRYPKGYRFLRNASILNLPHEATLKRFEENAVRFEDATPIPSPPPKSAPSIDHQVELEPAHTDQQLSTTLLATSDEPETGQVGFCSSDVNLTDPGELFDGPALSADNQLPDEVLDHSAGQQLDGDKVLIESVPMSLLHSRHLGPMGELSLANQELIRNFLLSHHQNGGVTLTELADGGATCCLVQDLTLCEHASGTIPHMSAERELDAEEVPPEIVVDAHFRDELMPEDVTSEHLPKETDEEAVDVGARLHDDSDDLIGSVTNVFVDGTIMEL